MAKRITRSTPQVVSQPVSEGVSASTASETTNSANSATFLDGIAPAPKAAENFATYLTGASKYWTLNLDADTTTGKPGPAIAEAGKPFIVNYYRGLADLGKSGTLASIKLHYRVNGGDIKTLPITDGTRVMSTGELLRLPASIKLADDAKGELAYWLELTTTDGKTAWDSDYGKNHRATIVPKGGSIIRFDEQWSAKTNEPIKAGSALRIAYDVDRLKQFLRGTNIRGSETWNITAFVKFDNGPAQEFTLTVPQRGQSGTYSAIVPWEVAVAVPKNASKVAFWFVGSAYGGSVFGGNAYDSNFGKNWVFPVER